MSPQEVEQCVEKVIEILSIKKFNAADSPILNKAMDWVKFMEQDVGYRNLQEKLIETICSAFTLTRADIISLLSGVPLPKLMQRVELSREKQLYDILPKGGWFEWYYEYTKKTESPGSYHLFSSLCVLGSALGRRVYKRMGFFSIYPNYCVVLIGPTGRVKKTSAVDIAKGLVTANALSPVMAEAVTPEALLEALSQSGHHFIYAPEFSSLFNKQKYNEGLSTKVIRLLDCPEMIGWKTLKRGEVTITNVAMTILGGTTPQQMVTSMPPEITSSGFLNRFVLVVESDTERCFPVPEKGSETIEKKLNETLNRIKHFEGEMHFTPEAQIWYDKWYETRWRRIRKIEDETEIEVLERAPVHLIRTAMLVHLAQCDNFYICVDCLEAASRLMAYVEKTSPATIINLKQSQTVQTSDYILRTLRSMGGASDHSSLLRRVCSKFNSGQFKQQIKTLEEAGRIRVSKKGAATHYILTGSDSDGN